MLVTKEFSFPSDFFIVDMPEDEEGPLILGQPFLLTSQCHIKVENSTLTLKAHDDEINLKVHEHKKQEREKYDRYHEDMIETYVESQIQRLPPKKVSRIISQKLSAPRAEKLNNLFQNLGAKIKSDIEVRLWKYGVTFCT